MIPGSVMRLVISAALVLVSLLSFPALSATRTINLTTENYPPFNMETADKQITGVSTEIVHELFDRANLPYEIRLYGWTRAYKLALETPWHGVFSTTRTKEREPLFQWVGPLVNNNWIFLAKKDKNITIGSLEDAKKYRVGGYRGDAVALYLQSQGFKLDLTSKDELNALKLDRGRIDLWATGHLLGPYYARQNNVGDLEPVFTFRETIMSIALNKDMPTDVIRQLNGELKKMREDGTVAKIYKRYE